MKYLHCFYKIWILKALTFKRDINLLNNKNASYQWLADFQLQNELKTEPDAEPCESVEIVETRKISLKKQPWEPKLFYYLNVKTCWGWEVAVAGVSWLATRELTLPFRLGVPRSSNATWLPPLFWDPYKRLWIFAVAAELVAETGGCCCFFNITLPELQKTIIGLSCFKIKRPI